MTTWFSDTFGFEELDRSKPNILDWSTPVYTNFVYNDPWLHCLAKNKRGVYRAGTFSTPSLFDVSETFDLARGSGGLCTLDIVEKDVSSLHADPANAGAVFMVASQFNCLEFSHASMTPEHGISIYANDRTQGPACSLCCAAGTVIRNYFCFQDEKRSENPGQTSDHMINNLCDIERCLDNDTHQYFRVHHGYTFGTEDGVQRLAKHIRALSTHERMDLKNHLRVGLLEGTQVVGLGLKGNNPDHVVTHVLASALSLSAPSPFPADFSNRASVQTWEPFARLILEGAYEFTLMTAANLFRQGRCTADVFVTLLGGGAFGNPVPWILDALESALRRVQHVPLRVHLVLFRQAPCARMQQLVNNWR